jgi:CheY-like chemotaxis protein
MRPRDTPPMRIVVAEDDPDDRLLLSEALEVAGFDADLRFFDDGVELLDYLRADTKHAAVEVDLIVLDLNMPRKDGRATLRDLKADPHLHRIPVLILTTSSAQRDEHSCRSNGACAFFVKPPGFARLVDAVRRFPTFVLRSGVKACS